MNALRPFWRYFGGKWAAVQSGWYPAPRYGTIIEPFAGAARYACHWPDRDVILIEKNPKVAAIWRWLIAVDPAEVQTKPNHRQKSRRRTTNDPFPYLLYLAGRQSRRSGPRGTHREGGGDSHGEQNVKKTETIDNVSNGGADGIAMTEPYVVEVTVEGVCPILFHAWNCEAIEEKASAAKGSKSKKTDNLESYIYRNEDGEISIPGEYLRMAIIHAAKFRQDPRSPRKSAMDLFKAGVVSLTELATLGVKDWDYLDRRRVMVQRNGITRQRPAMRQGWKATFQIQIQTPEYIPHQVLHEVIANAGRLVGLGDFRPSFGRYQVVKFEVLG